MASRAGVIVTGTEVLTGRVADRNGPWLAEQLRLFGVDIAAVVVVGDRPTDLTGALEYLAGSGVDLIITSGGLGPTADDLTAEVVASFQGRPMQLDRDLEQVIARSVARLSALRNHLIDPDASAVAVSKQASVPTGASVIAPIGTAPGLIIAVADSRSGPPVVVLPGPPRELQAMWPAVLADPTVGIALAARTGLDQRTIRLWGPAEPELAATLRSLEDGPDALAGLEQLEVTTCLREGELEIVTRLAPSSESVYARFEAALVGAYRPNVISIDGRTVDQVVADGLIAQKLTIATAESCTAGLLAGRLTDLAGSSAYVLGALVVYSNAAKHDLAGVPTDLIDRVGAVSLEVAAALAEGARTRLGTDIGVGITGIAGPGGGSSEKPVGLVYLCVATSTNSIERKVNLPGSRADVRRRAVAIAMHMIRELLESGQGG